MQKYGVTFKTVTIDVTILSPPNLFYFPNFDYAFKNSIKYICVYIYLYAVYAWVGVYVCVCVCGMGTAGKEVVLAGITWFSKGQGFDPSVVQQRSCRKA